MEISIDYDKCYNIKCLECLDICPMNIFDIRDDKLVFDSSRCVGCRACEDVCGYDAIVVLY